jgi:hypothetical protein
MSDIRKNVQCAYCGASFTIKWDAENSGLLNYCCFCGETVEDLTEELDTVEEDDYPKDENELS